jgi:CRISPR-associated endoribonuclease Cas6
VPARLIVNLRPKTLHEAGLWPDTGPAVQAHVLRAVREVDRRLAELVHAPAGVYAGGRWPYAVTPILDANGHVDGDGLWRFEVGVLDERLVDIFARALRAAAEVRLGHSLLLVTNVEIHAISYTDLAEQSAATRSWRLRLVTPLTFRTDSTTGAPRAIPLPTAELVFGSLLSRWEHFADPGLLDPAVAATVSEHVALADFELRASRHLVKGPDICELGAKGWVRYEAVQAKLLSPAVLRGVTALVNFAAFAGVGDRTTKGMGCVLPLGP